MEGEIAALKTGKDRAEENVKELKDKLREEVTKHQTVTTQAATSETAAGSRKNGRERY